MPAFGSPPDTSLTFRGVLGWNIGIYRLPNLRVEPGASPTPDELARAAEEAGERVAVWQTGLGGCDWLEDLAREGKAVDLGGDGYPNRYSATAAVLLPPVLAGPPEAYERWAFDVGDVLLPNWEGETTIDAGLAARCAPEEWLLVDAWDES